MQLRITVFLCLSSGAPEAKDIEDGLLNADRVGEEAYKTFIQERLFAKSIRFNAPIIYQGTEGNKNFNFYKFSDSDRTSKKVQASDS